MCVDSAEQCADGPLMQAFVVVLEIGQLSRQMGLSRLSLSDGSKSCQRVCLMLLARWQHARYGSRAARLLLSVLIVKVWEQSALGDLSLQQEGLLENSYFSSFSFSLKN